MPTYPYQCSNENCEKREFEVVQKITDEKLKTCPTCQSDVKRLVSGKNFLLTGTGWFNSGGY